MNQLPVPLTVLNAHCAVLGKTGAGKSSLLRVIVEDLLRRGKRVCVIDPKGDWFGLKLSADGKSKGFPVITFGDFVEEKATDVPINEHSGKHVAELISSGNRPCVIGFRGWMPGRMTKFWIDFASTLFNSKSGELYLIGDEFHNFAPKGKVMDPEAGKSLHWSNRLLSEGRGLGLVILIASQRPQKVHNDTLTCCETLFAMRVVHSADRGAIEDWIDGCGDPAQGKDVLASVASLKRGEAYVWCPEHEFGPKRVQFPMFTTFDSFAPPQLQKKISAAGWAGVDLDAVKEKMAAVIEEAKANDPAELKRRIRELEKQLTVPKTDHKPVIEKVPVLSEDERHRLGQLIGWMERAIETGKEDLGAVAARLEGIHGEVQFFKRVIETKVQPLTARPPVPVSPRHSTPRTAAAAGERHTGHRQAHDDGVTLGKCERAILGTLATHSDGCSIGKLALLSGYTQSGSFKNCLSALRTNCSIEGDNGSIMRITEEGLRHGPFETLPTGQALADYWLNFPHFGKCERAILGVLIENERGLMLDDLCDATNYEKPASGSFKNSLSALRTAGVVEGRNSDVMKASDDFFQ